MKYSETEGSNETQSITNYKNSMQKPQYNCNA